MAVVVALFCLGCAHAGSGSGSGAPGDVAIQPGASDPLSTAASGLSSAAVASPRPGPTATSRLTAYPARLEVSPHARPAGGAATGPAVVAFAGQAPGANTLVTVLVLADGSQATVPLFTAENIMLSPDGRYLIRPTAGPDGQRLATLRDLTTGVERQFDEPHYPIAWSPNSRSCCESFGATRSIDRRCGVQAGTTSRRRRCPPRRRPWENTVVSNQVGKAFARGARASRPPPMYPPACSRWPASVSSRASVVLGAGYVVDPRDHHARSPGSSLLGSVNDCGSGLSRSLTRTSTTQDGGDYSDGFPHDQAEVVGAGG
jgi:hypothetical protein